MAKSPLSFGRTFSLRTLLLAMGLVCVACAVWAYIPDPNNTLPMARLLSRELLPAIKNAKQPQLIWVGEETIVSSGGSQQEYWLAVVNPTPHTLHYHGYRMDSWEHRPPWGEISPFFSEEYQTTAGWVPVNHGRCGTGAGELAIKPGHAARFRVYNHERYEPFRVRLNYTLTTRGKPNGGGVLVSEPWPNEGS